TCKRSMIGRFEGRRATIGSGRTETHANLELVGFSLLCGVSTPQSPFFRSAFLVRSTMSSVGAHHPSYRAPHEIPGTKRFERRAEYAVLRTRHLPGPTQSASRRCLPRLIIVASRGNKSDGMQNDSSELPLSTAD